MTMMRAIVLLSGGVDSYTAAATVKARGFALNALTVQYGQRHVREVESARAVARSLGVERHLELPIDLRSIGGSALTSDLAVPKHRDLTSSESPSTYVPARNTIFLSLALAWAEVLDARDIVIGVNALDYSGYPDVAPPSWRRLSRWRPSRRAPAWRGRVFLCTRRLSRSPRRTSFVAASNSDSTTASLTAATIRNPMDGPAEDVIVARFEPEASQRWACPTLCSQARIAPVRADSWKSS